MNKFFPNPSAKMNSALVFTADVISLCEKGNATPGCGPLTMLRAATLPSGSDFAEANAAVHASTSSASTSRARPTMPETIVARNLCVRQTRATIRSAPQIAAIDADADHFEPRHRMIIMARALVAFPALLVAFTGHKVGRL